MKKTDVVKIALLLALAFVFAGCMQTPPAYTPPVTHAPTAVPEATPTPTPEPTPEPRPEAATRVVHAGGDFGEYSATNSKEAIDAAYDAGCRYIELDFAMSSDGEPICIHDWNTNYLRDYTEDDFPLSLEQFESSLIYGELTPLTLDALARWLLSHDEAYIITDVKEENLSVLGMIALRYPELTERLIPQIYKMTEIDAVCAMGYENIILTLYLEDWEVKTDAAYIADFAKENELWGLTFPTELIELEGYVDTLLESGVNLYVHTVNDEQEIERLIEMGLTGVYSDKY